MHSALFVSGLLLLGIAMLVLFEWLPRYTAGSWLGITRPDLILAPALWAGAGYLSWRRRARGEIHDMFALMSAIMVLANVAVLYSQSVDDAPVKQFAFFRQHRAAARPVKQPDAEMLLELSEHPAYRGLGNVQLGCGSRKAAVARSRVEHKQRIAGGQHPAKLRHNVRLCPW